MKRAGDRAPGRAGSCRRIDQETARQMMAQDNGHVVVDVRRHDEYAGGHIPGAVCIPNETIGADQPEELPNPDQVILIYCRSGNRSRQASEKLARMGYTNLYEFGGIIDWTGQTVKGQMIALTVESNPTTGFRWEAAQDPERFDILESCTPRPQSAPVCGAGGWQTFLLTPRQPGTVRLTFAYSRPWESGDADLQFACTLEISEDLTITVTEDGRGAAEAHGYHPVWKRYGDG